jgi:hypothetical protein
VSFFKHHRKSLPRRRPIGAKNFLHRGIR